MRSQHTKGFHVLVLKLLIAALKKCPAERERCGFSAALYLSCAMWKQGVDREHSLCVAAVCLTALTKIKFLRFKKMPKQNKMTAEKCT